MSSEVRMVDEGAGPRPLRPRRRPPASRRLVAVGAPLVALVLTLAGCTGASSGTGSVSPVARSSAAPPSDVSPTPAPDAVITATPAVRAGVDPAEPVQVSVADGTLTAVALLNPVGTAVHGALSPDATSWHNTEDLGYSKTYRLSVSAVNKDGKAVTHNSSFTTLTPGNMTMPYLNTTGGDALQNGAVYGIGIVPVVHFDESITDKKAAEQALVVTTDPPVTGVWNWVSDTDAHWRPEHYFAPGTKVTVAAKVYGVQVGPGLYGQADQSVSFTIGASHISVADDATHTVKVFFGGKLVRTMPTSMGRGGWVTGSGGQQISLWTMPGVYTVISHHDPVLMDSATFGIPENSPIGYKEYIYQATQISTDGIYLHELDATVWAQGNTDVSHGCLNLNYDNAHFFYTTSHIGDIVKVIHTGGPALQIWQNGDWSVPWSTWIKGSAL